MWRGWRLAQNRYVMSAMVPRGRMRESGGCASAVCQSVSQSHGRAKDVWRAVSVARTERNRRWSFVRRRYHLAREFRLVRGRLVTRGVTVSGKGCRGGAFSYVASALAARGAVTTTRPCVLADILDSPAMESIRKWFYRPKVSAFRSVALKSRFPSLFPRFAFVVPARPLLPSFLSAFLVVWLSWSNACARSFFTRPSSPSCWACALLPPVSWKFARYPERCASGDALHLRGYRYAHVLHWYAHGPAARPCLRGDASPLFFADYRDRTAYKEIATSLIEAGSSGAGRARPNQLIRNRAWRFLIFWAARAAAGSLDAMFFSTTAAKTWEKHRSGPRAAFPVEK